MVSCVFPTIYLVFRPCSYSRLLCEILVLQFSAIEVETSENCFLRGGLLRETTIDGAAFYWFSNLSLTFSYERAYTVH
jgi:hypothetical protein